MKTEERTLDVAFAEFVILSKLPQLMYWIYMCFRKPVFPICVEVDDSRLCPLQKDTDDDYLLKKHFLTIKKEESGLYVLACFITIEPMGEQNEPYEMECEESPYCWPVRSLKHAQRLIPGFMYAMNMPIKTT
jgi:hypothetical protein